MQVVDAHNNETQTSVTYMTMFEVLAKDNVCLMHVATLAQTRSGEHKFKVGGRCRGGSLEDADGFIRNTAKNISASPRKFWWRSLHTTNWCSD